jgi:hypothetical protein
MVELEFAVEHAQRQIKRINESSDKMDSMDDIDKLM